MTTEFIIEHLRSNWWILLFVIPMTTWYIYSWIRDYAELKKAKDKKKELEKEMAELEVKYSEAAIKLEEKMKEREKFFKGGRK
jgi:uncharacterized membrane protein (DUF106 family)